MKKILAIDLGGSTAKIAFLDTAHQIAYNYHTIETKRGGNVLKNLWKEIKQIEKSDFDAVGFATPGMVDEKNGIVLTSGNLGWSNLDLRKELEKYTDKPCFIINDANAAALGESWVGSGGKFRNLLFYTIGTGVGGAIIIDNKLVTGYRGTAGEFGHGGDFQRGKSCNCGLSNCLEPIASASGIKTGLLKLDVPKNLRDITNDDLKNDPSVRNVFKKHWDILADHISILIYALNPEAVIVGGGVSNIGGEISEILYSLICQKVTPKILHKFQVVNATLGNKAGIYGAAKYCIDNLSF